MRILLAVLASGAMWFLSTGVNHFWPLAWLAPLPLLVVLPELGAGRAALAAFAAMAIGALNLILTYNLPPVVLAVALLLLPMPYVAAASLWRIVARRASPGIAIVAGFNSLDTPPRNQAVVFGPDGGVALEYDKVHLVPGFEQGYRAGTAIGVVAGAARPTGVAICKDMDFVPLGRAYARAGVGLLLVPAWDFVDDGWIHSRMAVLRGVEGGYAVARSAARGLLTVSDARGRVLAERASGAAPEVLLTAVVPVGRGGTFYSRTGDWFAWLSAAVALASLARALRSGMRGRTPART